MIESLLNGLFSINDFWNKTKDPVLAEYRCYVRNMIIYTLTSILLFITSMIVSPTDQPIQGIDKIFNQLREYIEAGLSIAFLYFILASLWNLLLIYFFSKKYGIND